MAHISKQQYIAAAEGSKGIIAHIARKLGCSRNAVYNAMRRFPDFEEAVKEARGELIDLAESKLVDAIKNDSLPAIMFTLRTVGHANGWAERQQIDLTSNEKELKSLTAQEMTTEQLRDAIRDHLDSK